MLLIKIVSYIINNYFLFFKNILLFTYPIAVSFFDTIFLFRFQFHSALRGIQLIIPRV